MLLGRGFLISTLFVALIFISTLDAKKCNNFQFEKYVKPGEGKSDDECSGCTGYICKIGGKNILGSACTEDVKEICGQQQNWDDSKLKSIAEEKKYQSEKGKYFVFSCQEDNCNSVQWVTDSAATHYAKEIAASDLSFDDGSFTRGQRVKREEDLCEHMTEVERKKQQAVFDAMPLNLIKLCPQGVGGAEEIGYGIGLLVAILGYFFFNL